VYSHYYGSYTYFYKAERVYNIDTKEKDWVLEDDAVYSCYYDLWLIRDQTVYSEFYDTYLMKNEYLVYSEFMQSYIDKSDEKVYLCER